MTRVAVSSSSALAADAGVSMAEHGGNAVDAALAASVTQLVTEPGVVSLAAGAFIVIWPADGAPVMVDGGCEMPGREADAGQLGAGVRDVLLDYGGGTPTAVGHGTVATPGALAGYALAHRQYGRLPWPELFAPAIRCLREGFPLPRASERYLDHTHEGIFGWNPAALTPLLDAGGRLLRAGDRLRLADLGDTLEEIAHDGVAAFYRGAIAQRMAGEIDRHGGLLGPADLSAYRAREVPALEVALHDWRFATAATPSVGGAALAAILLLMRELEGERWDAAATARLVEAQSAVLRYRARHLDAATAPEAAAAALLETARSSPDALFSPSTVHTSAVDDTGLACAVTASAGYGAGVLVPGTGIWLNNALGEAELNRGGVHRRPAGTRLPSNMAPTTGRGPDGSALAIGSPGADRITTAIAQAVLNFAVLGMPLARAVDHPRLHVERTAGEALRVAFEPGMPVDGLGLERRAFPELDMFFGGVTAVRYRPPDAFEGAADARRTGGVRIGGPS